MATNRGMEDGGTASQRCDERSSLLGMPRILWIFLGTLPPTNVVPVGRNLEDRFPLEGPPVRCHVSGISAGVDWQSTKKGKINQRNHLDASPDKHIDMLLKGTWTIETWRPSPFSSSPKQQ